MNTLLDAERIHLELLEKWRAAMNLIGPGPAEHHFMDARGAVASLGARGRWADLGSGAGFRNSARHPQPGGPGTAGGESGAMGRLSSRWFARRG